MGTRDECLAAVLRHAEQHRGIFSVDEARDHGLSKTTVARLVERRLLERVAPGYVRAAHLRWTLDARHQQALLLVGGECSIGGRSALHHWGMSGRPERIEILAPWGRRGTPGALRVIQSTDIAVADSTRHRGLTVSTPIRALIDAARWLGPLALEQALSAGIQKGHVSLDQLRLRFAELARRGRPGVRAMRRCLANFGDAGLPFATSFEQDFERLVSLGGFPPPVRQFRVVADGRVYFLDHAWPELRTWSECDSMLAHGSAESLRGDLERQNRIIAATGFEPIRFTYFDVHERPNYVLDILRLHLQSR